MISLFGIPKALILSLLLFLSTCHSNVASLSSQNSNTSVLLSGGLINMGNTCYLNSQLECAYHIPYVRKMIVNPKLESACSDEDGDSTSDDSSSTSNPSLGLLAMSNLFTSMQKSSKHGNGDPILTPATSTSILCRSLGIRVYEQQDAQEFFKLLLPTLEYPALSDLYKGNHESYIAALDGSKREKKRSEVFLDLSLDVTNFDSVHDTLEEMFTSGEVLSVKEGNGWRPAKGEDKVDALKGSTLSRTGLPKILQLHLLRFSYDWNTDVMSKINDRFSFGKELDLTEICNDDDDGKNNENDMIYDLQSIVVHAGEYGSGHYYAYIRPDARKKTWYRYDDDRVTEVSFKEVKNDAFGGHLRRKKKAKPVGFWARWFKPQDDFGWGGRKSSAYMLQYVKRSDIPLLYK